MSDDFIDPRSLAVIQAHKVSQLAKGAPALCGIIRAAADYAYEPEVLLHCSLKSLQKQGDRDTTLSDMKYLGAMIDKLWPARTGIEIFSRFAKNVSQITAPSEIGTHALDHYLGVCDKTMHRMEIEKAITETGKEIIRCANGNKDTAEALIPLIAAAHQSALEAQIPIEEERMRESWDRRRKPVPGLPWL
jgi:hypothetical protein